MEKFEKNCKNMSETLAKWGGVYAKIICAKYYI